MGLEDNLPEFATERVIELVRRVGNNDYSGVDLGGATPEDVEPELLTEALAFHLFPVEGSVEPVKFQRSGNRVADDYASGFETAFSAVKQIKHDTQYRFENYGLIFSGAAFSTERDGKKSSLWTPEVRGRIKFLGGEFDSLDVTARFDDDSNIDYMKFIESFGRVSRLTISNYAVAGIPFPLDISFERYEAFHQQRRGNYTRENVDSYVESELDIMAKTIGKASEAMGSQAFKRNFNEGRVNSVAFFDTENPRYAGVFLCAGKFPCFFLYRSGIKCT